MCLVQTTSWLSKKLFEIRGAVPVSGTAFFVIYFDNPVSMKKNLYIFVVYNR